MDTTTSTAPTVNSLQCSSCGATLQFAPGTHHLTCQYCGAANEIADTDTRPVEPVDYAGFIASMNGGSAAQTARVVACKNCGASTTLPPEVNSDTCVFCASPLVLSEAQNKAIIRPHYILPFIVAQKKALEDFRSWLNRLWWAPSDLNKLVSGDAQQFKGIYIPHWSYDAQTVSDYAGLRGDYYYVTETYTETDDDGNTVERTREVRQTAWSPVSGTVGYEFNDVLISASHSLPQDVANRLEPWKLEALVHYNEQYVSGFRSELFQLDPEKGLEEAQRRMQPVIRNLVCQDIGGDEQTIEGITTTYNNLGLKYILLPAWISTYKYNNKVYHFTVNACTGEVVGERPYSAMKIALAVLAVIALIIFIVMMVQK
jgi:LSD1 subclass zinc finger protein